MSSSDEWVPVRTFAQLKPGCAIRSTQHPHLTGVYRGNGHGLAVIRLDVYDVDRLCRPTELDVKLEK